MLRFHHIGCAVASIEAALAFYRPNFPNISPPIQVMSQSVTVCFVEMGPGLFIELIEPLTTESAVKNLVRKGFTFYHVGFLVSDFDAALASLIDQEYRPGETFRSEAFAGKRCCFLISPVMHMIEIIEE
jgi:hypothetical protein